MVFNPELTRDALPPFSMQQQVPTQGAIADYCRFYQLDFEQDFPQYQHLCGYFDVVGYRLVAHCFYQEKSRGTVWILHGYLEHSGLYKHIIPVLLANHYSVLIYDLPAHGLSSGARASIHHFVEYQKILQHLIAYFDQKLPKPYLALGQSTGGAILMDYVLNQYQAGQKVVFDRLLLLAPLVYPAKMQWLQMKLAFWWFKSTRSGLPRIFRHNTHDQNFIRFMRDEDPLQARWIPLSWLLALKEWIDYIHQFSPCAHPVWIVQGGQDRTVNGEYNIRFIKQRFDTKKVLFLPNAGHQLVNENGQNRQQIIAFLEQFLTNGNEELR